MNACEKTGKHQRPVHLNKKPSHIWICLECGKQIGGPTILQKELDALVLFVKSISDKPKTEKEKAV